MKLFRIKRNTGDVRLTLCVEDIELLNKKVLVEFGLVTIDHKGENSFLVFKEPYRVPYFNVFYASKIKNAKDKFLPELVKRLLYLNPNPDDLMLKKIASCIVHNFVVTNHMPSKVKLNELAQTPVMTFEEVFSVVCTVYSLGVEYVPDTERFIMYSRSNTLSRKEKISINSNVRMTAVTRYYESAIHNAAEYLNERDDLLKITEARIKDTEMVQVGSKAIASERTISRYMAERTKSFIRDTNRSRPFKGQIGYEKFTQFLELPHMSLEDAAFKLNVSKSTIAQYRDIKHNYTNILKQKKDE